MHPSRTLTIGAVTASLLVASGCGGGGMSESDFKNAYAAQRTSLNATGSQIVATIQRGRRSTDAQLQRAITREERKLRGELDKLDALKPPSKYKDDFGAVTGASNRVDADLRQIASAVGAHDSRAAKKASSAFLGDGSALQAAGEKLRKSLGLPAQG